MGGTPWRQQLAIIVGVVTSVIVIGWTLQALNNNNRSVQEARYEVVLQPAPGARTETGLDGQAYRLARAGGLDRIPDGSYLVDEAGQVRYRLQEGIGSDKAPAPQATLMSLVTKGILTRKLPWGLALLGVFTSILMEIIGVPALAFAVGMYVPLESTTPVFLGGLARRAVEWKRGSESESDAGPGVLFSSGLVAGGSIMGLFAVALAAEEVQAWLARLGVGQIGFAQPPIPGGVGFLLFCVVAYLIYRTAVKAKSA